MRMNFIACLLALAGAVIATPAEADSWMLPETELVLSPDGKARATIVPRQLESQLAYFSDDEDKPGQAAGGNPQARAKVEVQAADGTWRPLWEGPLANDVAPVGVLLTDGGRHLVTFDNWHSVGYGREVVVLYDGAGRLVRQWALAEFLGKRYVQGLPHSVSSIGWRHEPKLSKDQGRAEISVVVPSDDLEEDEPSQVVVFELSFADATLAPRDPALWEQAQQAGEKAAAAVDAERQKWLDELAAPFPSPVGKGEADWRAYDRQLHRRLYVRLGVYLDTFILLPAKGHEDYAQERGYVDGFAEQMTVSTREYREQEFTVAYASVEPHDMYRALLPAVRAAPAGAWVGARVIYVGEAEHDAGMRAAVERTGATYVFVDIARPLPGEHPNAEPDEE